MNRVYLAVQVYQVFQVIKITFLGIIDSVLLLTLNRHMINGEIALIGEDS